MRKSVPERLEAGRLRDGRYGSSPADGFNGAFFLQGPHCELKILASDGLDPDLGQGWEHVSVSCKSRAPNWFEMCWIKDLFWGEEETVIQYHPPRSDYVNCHPYCLHLWRNRLVEMPRPPSILVGPKGVRHDPSDVG